MFLDFPPRRSYASQVGLNSIGPTLARAPVPEQQLKNAYVLVVDDSPTMRRMVIASLKAMGNVEFGEAASGLEAVEKLAISDVDLMILDLNMPEMHGLDVLRFVTAHKKYRDMPIIVLTTRDDESSRTDAISAGATEYMTKPFQSGELLSHVSRILQRD